MEDIERLRKKIDKTDEQILHFLRERVEICRSIGLLKNSHGMPVADPFREHDVYKKIRGKARDFGLDADQLETIYHQIIKMCSLVQEPKKEAE